MIAHMVGFPLSPKILKLVEDSTDHPKTIAPPIFLTLRTTDNFHWFEKKQFWKFQSRNFFCKTCLVSSC